MDYKGFKCYFVNDSISYSFKRQQGDGRFDLAKALEEISMNTGVNMDTKSRYINVEGNMANIQIWCIVLVLVIGDTREGRA